MMATPPHAPLEFSISPPYIIGIGASAGGLEAINELFDNMPANTGFSFIIVQHLSPNHKSLMSELLSKHTEMQVYEAEDNMPLTINTVYLIPAGKTLTLKGNRLKLEEKIRDHQPNNAIDVFFETLAKEKVEKAVGIILSGTGTDGTKGIQAIKNKGGTVLVQDPVTAQFDGMPNSAISSGFADLILSPDLMPEELMDFLKEAPLIRAFNTLTNQEEGILRDILELVHKVTGHDFSNYKRPTINRRMSRRMVEFNFNSVADYYHFLKEDNEEVKKLCKEFLLHVTRFFRDEEAFDLLKALVIPDILRKKEGSEGTKVWTAACSTGEEAYSLAMIFDECLGILKIPHRDIKIFASDISQDAIDIASKGYYTDEQVKSVSTERLKRFFIKEGGGYRVHPNLRKMIVFARQDISRDPPFSKIDLLTCRNVLIYMNPILQKSILQKFHFAINDNGYIFLGPSENISILKDVMSETDKKWKIYKCISKSRVADLEAFSNPSDPLLTNTLGITAKSKNALANMSDIFKDTLLEEYAYAGIFIDKNFEVKQALGHFKKFMEFPENNFNFNLLKLVPPDLSSVLSNAIRKATNSNERVVQRNVKYKSNSVEMTVTLIVKPYLVQKTYLQPFLFVILKEEETAPRKSLSTTLTAENLTAERATQLEQELLDTKANLQALIEEVESSNEELQSSNEEIISSNEELQSTNEELQSLNEELHTVNAEHQLKIKELSELNDDLNNYFSNTEIGQILIDRRLIIRKFTPAATKQVNLINSDIGRSIVDISNNIRNLNLINDIKSVLQNDQVLEKEIPVDGGRTFLMRIAPYLRLNKSKDGVVVTFMDVTEVKKLNSVLQAVFDSSPSGILSFQEIRNQQTRIIDFEVTAANKVAASLLGLDNTAMTGNFNDIFGQGNQMVFDKLVAVKETGQTVAFEWFVENILQWYDIVVIKMLEGLVVTMTNITDRKTSSEKIEQSYEALKASSRQMEVLNYELQQSNLDLLQFASVASHDLKEPLRKIQVFGNLLKEGSKEKLNEKETNYLSKMINSSSRMQVLIENILILSRLSRHDTPFEAVPLKEVIHQIIDDLEISMLEKGVTINIGSLPVVNGIAGQIHQLFQNLISNSIKFNLGKPVIDIWAGDVSDGMSQEFHISSNDYIGLHIKDNGIGFDEKYSKKIFGIFQRLEPTNYQGSGIGLAIVKKLVENHKGFIKAVGIPGEGAHFVIALPK